jgi:hypothetical protein
MNNLDARASIQVVAPARSCLAGTLVSIPQNLAAGVLGWVTRDRGFDARLWRSIRLFQTSRERKRVKFLESRSLTLAARDSKDVLLAK